MKIKIVIIFLISVCCFSSEVDREALKNIKNYQLSNDLLDSQKSIILVINPKTGEIIESSIGARKFYGYNNLDSLNISNLNTMSDKEIKKEMAKAVKEDSNYFHFKHKLNNGEIRDVSVSSYPMIKGDQPLLLSIVQDITEQEKIERNRLFLIEIIISILSFGVLLTTILALKIRHAKEKYKNLFKNMTIGFIHLKMIYNRKKEPDDYIFLDVNPYFEKLTGISQKVIIGKKVKTLFPDLIDYKLKTFDKVIKKKVSINYKYYFPKMNKLFSYRAFATTNMTLALVFSDITEQEVLKKKLEEEKEKAENMATHDFLTGLPNRILFQNEFNRYIEHAKLNQTSIAICMFDMDKFKSINDTYGHLVGDLVLKEIGKRVEETIRACDVVSRFGGDEFACLITNFKSHEECEIIVKRIIKNVNKIFQINECKIFPSISIGIAIFPQNGTTENELVKKADTALYYIKNHGKNNYHFYGK
ncbi:MAG: sensor domain-containing diguanylate cyclase [Fusobacteriaceae bacterium]|nr:sensor domain-containing diguanylate cyclase [Fusobacteriaceae bacterium]